MDTVSTNREDLKLISPDIERDAPLSVAWLAGDVGKETLRLMGNLPEDIKPTSLELERQRVQDFINSDEQLTWMMELDGKVVGSIWVHTTPTEYVNAPSLHLMIGDPSSRGRGVGKDSCRAVIEELRRTNSYKTLYSRYITDNKSSAALLASLGFEASGEIYVDKDGLEWQNVLLDL